MSNIKKKILVLDLDETLVHATKGGMYGGQQITLTGGYVRHKYVAKRPHVDYFLHVVSEWYTLVTFTAGISEYSDNVVNLLDPDNKLIAKRFARESCTMQGKRYLKDLKIVDSDLSNIFILDNNPISYALNKENGIPIKDWISDPTDTALLDLLPFLEQLSVSETAATTTTSLSSLISTTTATTVETTTNIRNDKNTMMTTLTATMATTNPTTSSSTISTTTTNTTKKITIRQH
ncbi:hypothetical protein Glove_493g47 [Diversispora epigaea]|uniref:FCP1 homology domain-containing protein n=1 Tax=Diversispora epigaea TaxID=1348612 RepID=A0A397GJJ6_9GLOM|nr:hypothetical protein Glove_493g47 [Diversispora epigaea]